jgi:hypothetical protein
MIIRCKTLQAYTYTTRPGEKKNNRKTLLAPRADDTTLNESIYVRAR